jgi:NUMOD4 motif/HNH endonuclease/Helix-turn-helix domain of resolvase
VATPKHTTVAQLPLPFARVIDLRGALPPEEWRPVPGFEDCYEVSNLGQVRSLPRFLTHRDGHTQHREGVVLKGSWRNQYQRVCLQHLETGRKQSFWVYHLVLEAFVGPRPPGYVCNHKDRNRANNVVSNLEWVTPKRNMQHAHQTGINYRHGIAHYLAKYTDEDIRRIRRLYRDGMLLEQIAELFTVTRQSIWQIVHRKAWKHVR